jgi:phosphatidate cytidylyltransferase
MADAGRKSDLAVRTASAIVMLAVAGTAVYMGGTVFMFFVALVAFLVVLEWRGLVVQFPDNSFTQGIWMMVGGVYAALSCAAVLILHNGGLFLPLLAAVIGTDIGAYFAGRTFGGPKIAPVISPSKTWSGLFGGMAGAALLFWCALRWLAPDLLPFASNVALTIGTAALLAIVAQAGDFFESWMKRRAGVKDSGTLIPGHGGMFDRVDGLLSAALAFFILAKWLTP